MKTFIFLAVGTASILAGTHGNAARDIRIVEGASPLPGLTSSVQNRNAMQIIAQAREEKIGQDGCEAAIATGLTESDLQILANKEVPASLKFNNDGLGSDHDSIGIFQQRASIYKDIACDMKADCSARQFFRAMMAVKGWKTMDVATLCQRVQSSTYPTAYTKHTATAAEVCKAGL